MQKRVSNNLLFVLAVFFFLVSLLNSVIVFKIIPTGAATQTGYIDLCIKHGIAIENLTLSYSVIEMRSLSFQVLVRNVDNSTLEFHDNTTLFEINSTTGLVNFTPQAGQAGNYSIKLWANETDAYCFNDYSAAVIAMEVIGEYKNDTLDIWASTSARGGSRIRYKGENVEFYANYTNSFTGEPLTGPLVSCQVRFNISQAFTDYESMSYNSSSTLYQHARSFDHPGTYFWEVLCNASLLADMGAVNLTGNATITNRAPILVSNMPVEHWNMNTILTGRDLDDYFIDPDGDALTYNSTRPADISVSIHNATHIITYTPATNFNGARNVIFYAHDPYGAEAASNVVVLIVVYVAPPQPSAPSGGGGGGGGGGGAVSLCDVYWDCTPWSECTPNNISVRSCTDLSECNTTYNRPNESIKCIYQATCSDKIRNCHNGSCEEQVDCGGPCTACQDCHDKLKNREETDVDCGGRYCPHCEDSRACLANSDCLSNYCYNNRCRTPSCSDAIRNQDETDVDCGGSCPKCVLKVAPQSLPERVLPLSAWLIFGVSTFILFLTFKSRRRIHALLARLIAKLSRLLESLSKEKEKPELDIRALTLTSLAAMHDRLMAEDASVLSRELISVMKDFFKRMLEVTYEPTYEELAKELKQHKGAFPAQAAALSFITRLSRTEYGGYAIDRPALEKLIEQAEIVAHSSFLPGEKAQLPFSPEQGKKGKKDKAVQK